MKQVTVNIQFPRDIRCSAPYCNVQKVIAEALKTKGIKITKYRNTYIESKHGIADLHNNLFLANLIDTPSGAGFEWKLPDLSGKYKFTFRH